MDTIELQKEREKILRAIEKLDTEYLMVKNKSESFDIRKEIKGRIRALNTLLVEINKQMKEN